MVNNSSGVNTSGNLFQTSLTANGILYASSTGVITSTAVGTATQVLTSNGTGVAPTYQAAPAPATTAAFLVFLATSVGNVTGDGTVYPVLFDTTAFDTGSNITLNSSGKTIFTAPVTGRYQFNATLNVNGLSAPWTDAYCTIVTTSKSYYFGYINPGTSAAISGGYLSFTGSVIASMTATDTAYVQISLSGSTKTRG